jgi:N6-L-threonylcarbamoyladenine synthase
MPPFLCITFIQEVTFLKILSIETSCDETAAAVVENGRTVLSDIVFSQQDFHKKFGGVVPEIASRMHIEHISQVVNEAIATANCTHLDIDAIAVTYAPGLIGALLTGIGFAKGLSLSLSAPLIPVHHIRAHICSNYITHSDLEPPFICLVASGGHSHIVEVLSYTDYKIIGRTRDDAAGEAFDKIARVLGLSYPGGAVIDNLSKTGNADSFKFPRVNFENSPYDFSFSGVKTNVVNLIHNLMQKGEAVATEDIAASFNKTVCETLADKLLLSVKHKSYKKVAIAGGVSANSYLRDYLQRCCNKDNLQLFLPQKNLCGDNAAMVGCCGYYEYLKGNIADISLNGYAIMDIENCTF